ncbi:MAG TPA: hypothetical protein VJN94_01100 [Candidatus Binataceae bacterium]|nr:hypothetical protein [Candidatus Binataceae bacterium]
MPRPHPLRILGWLIALAALLGVCFLLSYALQASLLVRLDNPDLGAWWDAHQFYFMEGGATVLGLLIGIRIGTGLASGHDNQWRAGLTALILGIIVLAPMVHLCAAAARLGWNGREASLASRIISREGFEAGRQVDKVVIAGIYFLKTVGFALLGGLALAAIAVIAMLPGGHKVPSGE